MRLVAPNGIPKYNNLFNMKYEIVSAPLATCQCE